MRSNLLLFVRVLSSLSSLSTPGALKERVNGKKIPIPFWRMENNFNFFLAFSATSFALSLAPKPPWVCGQSLPPALHGKISATWEPNVRTGRKSAEPLGAVESFLVLQSFPHPHGSTCCCQQTLPLWNHEWLEWCPWWWDVYLHFHSQLLNATSKLLSWQWMSFQCNNLHVLTTDNQSYFNDTFASFKAKTSSVI